MKRVVLLGLMVLLACGVAVAQEGRLDVPGKRIVVVQPGDVVIQASDLPSLGRFRIDVSASGEVEVTDVTPGRVSRSGEFRIADHDTLNPYMSSVTGECYLDSATTVLCPGNPAQTTRYIRMLGTYVKEDSNCFLTGVVGVTKIPALSSANTGAVSLVAVRNTVTRGIAIGYIGKTTAPAYNGNVWEWVISVGVDPVSRFTIYVDLKADFANVEDCN